MGEGMGVFDGEGGFPHATQAVDGGEHAHLAQGHGLAQPAQFGGASDEVWVVGMHVAEAVFRAFAAGDALLELGVELTHPLPHGGVAQAFRAGVKPRTQIKVLAAAQFGHPSGALLLKAFVLPARHLDEVDGRHAITEIGAPDFVLQILVELPLAVFTLEIGRRETGQQESGFAQALQYAMPPILHAVNLRDIEEWHQRTPGKCRKVNLDALHKLLDAALLVIAAGVRDEDVVWHWLFDGSGFQVFDNCLKNNY